MALVYDGAIQRLIDAFAKLPGIGPKGAQRIAFYLLSASDEESQNLIDAIDEVKTKVRFCEVCGNVCESSPCPICADPRRDRGVICVVEEVKDVMSIERTHTFHGLYHVLGGAINPMAGVGPESLNIPKLLERLKEDGGVHEVILRSTRISRATPPHGSCPRCCVRPASPSRDWPAVCRSAAIWNTPTRSRWAVRWRAAGRHEPAPRPPCVV